MLAMCVTDVSPASSVCDDTQTADSCCNRNYLRQTNRLTEVIVPITKKKSFFSEAQALAFPKRRQSLQEDSFLTDWSSGASL